MLDTNLYTLEHQTIDFRSILVDTVFVKPKNYNGTDSAYVDNVRFDSVPGVPESGLVPGEALVLGKDYSIDSAAFTSDSAGESKTVILGVSLADSATAKNYVLTNGANYALRGQRIEKAEPDTLLHLIFARDSVVVYDGAKHGIPVSLNPKYKGMDSIVVKYNDTTALPVSVGKYAVTVDLRNNVNFLDSLNMLLDTLTIAPDTIEITGATVKEKIYDGKDSATVTEVEFDGLENGQKLVLTRDYVVDSARFDNKNAGENNRKVTAYVSLTDSDTAKNYVLRSREHELNGQTILRSPQKILFSNTDTTIYVLHGADTLRAVDSTGGAPALPVLFKLSSGSAADASFANDSVLTPHQPGTVYVTAYIKPDDNYKDADSVVRKFIISDRDSCTVIFDTEWDFDTARVRTRTPLYARWGYTVRFNLNGGTSRVPNDTVVTANGTVTRPPVDPSQKGYRFSGWYTDSINYANEWIFETSMIQQDTTLYARWDTIKYSITYRLNAPNGRNHADNPDTFTVVTTPITLKPAALMGDSIFDGWYKSNDYNGTKVTTIAGGDTGNVVLWAKWTAKRKCNTYISNVNCCSFEYFKDAANGYPYYFPVSGGGADDDGDSIPNINDPDAPHFLLPGGGGNTSYCGNDIPNINCPDYPGFYLPGGGGDTSYCGYGIPNFDCPSFPGYNQPGGGGGSSGSIRHDTLTLTYSDTAFRLATDPAAVGERSFRWVSLAPEVATASTIGDVKLAGQGSTSIVCLTQPNDAHDAQQTNRVVMSVTLVVAPRPLTIVGTWVDTIKTFDGKRTAGVIAGALQGVLPRDGGSVAVQATAYYANGSHASSGTGKPIVVRYELTGSRAYCYVAPKDDATSGTIKESGRYSDVWGVVMKREEKGGVALPCEGVSVAYTVGGASAGENYTGTVLTDRYGRYLISGLGEKDAVALRPEERRTWTATPSQQTVTVNSSVMQADAFVYVPDKASLVSLALRDGSGGDALIQWEHEEIGDTTYYELPCNRVAATLIVEYVTPDADMTGKSSANGNSSRKSEEGIDDYAYPNPVRGGSKIYLKASLIVTGDGEERYATYRLYTSQGRLVLSGSASVLIDGLTVPEMAGAYYLILDGKAGRRAIQIAVMN